MYFLQIKEQLIKINFMVIIFEELIIYFQLLYLKLNLMNYVQLQRCCLIMFLFDFTLNYAKSVIHLTNCLVLFYLMKCFKYLILYHFFSDQISYLSLVNHLKVREFDCNLNLGYLIRLIFCYFFIPFFFFQSLTFFLLSLNLNLIYYLILHIQLQAHKFLDKEN